MAKVNMDSKKAEKKEVNTENRRAKSVMPTNLKNSWKLTQLLIKHDNRYTTYVKQKKQRALATKLAKINGKKPEKLNLAFRRVPKEKAKLTEMLHEYITAHKFKSAHDEPQTFQNDAFNLVTGESEAMKSQYSAVMMNPKEKVNQMLKYRDDCRK